MIMLFAPIKRLSEVNVTLQRGIAASESIFALLDSESESDKKGNHDIINEISISFKNINFKYESSKSLILKNISLMLFQLNILTLK